MGAAAAQEIGKADLAQALKWSRPRLDRRLNSDPEFPVLSRGDQGGGWKFDELQVKAHLKRLGEWDGPLPGAEPAAPKPSRTVIDPAQLRDAVAFPVPPAKKAARPSADRPSEATARARKENADAGIKEDKLALSRKELVVRSEVRQHIADVLVVVASGLDSLPDQIARKLQLDDAAAVIRELVDKIRVDMVTQARKKLDV